MNRRRFTAFLLIAFLAFAGVNLWRLAYAQTVRQNDRHNTEKYRRPKPTKPLKPTIPAANRYQSDKVFLEQADSLYRRGMDSIERQIVSGDVRFRHGSMWMFCDSAFYYPDLNSLDAFGNVKMQQGDTLFVFADKLFYDGDLKYAKLVNGPTRSNVKLQDSKGTLVTDTLHYYVDENRGFYDTWGTLDDGVNTLRSHRGVYDTDTKDAQFFINVDLENSKDGYTMATDTLYYNTATHIARIESVTDIFGPNDTIRATSGWYNTATDSLELTSRARIAHTDSLGRTVTLEGDSIIYDKVSRISRAYRFADSHRAGSPVVLTDTANHTTLVADYAYYNDITREAMATRYPLLMEYSRPDTIFLRADTILTFIRNELRIPRPAIDSIPQSDSIVFHDAMATVGPFLKPDSLPEDTQHREYRVAQAFRRARFFGQDVQGVADSIIVSQGDSLLRLIRKPVAWSGERQVTGGEIVVHFNDSSADYAYIPVDGRVMEHVEEEFFNQISGQKLYAILENGTLKHLDVDGNVQLMFLPLENDSTISRLVYAESGWMTVDMKEGELENLKMWPDVNGTVTPIFKVKKSEQRLIPGFVWLEAIRPKRSWYGDRLHWDDDLGELSEELELYFRE